MWTVRQTRSRRRIALGHEDHGTGDPETRVADLRRTSLLECVEGSSVQPAGTILLTPFKMSDTSIFASLAPYHVLR